MPLFWLSLAFLTGLLLAANVTIPLMGWMVIVAMSLMLIIPPVYHRWFQWIPSQFKQASSKLKIPSMVLYPLFVLFLCLGAIRYITSRPVIDPTFITYYNDQPVEYVIVGELADPPETRDTYTNLRVRVEQLGQSNGGNFSPVHGLLLARTSPGTDFRYGDRIRLQGHILTPAENEDFSFRDYLAHQGIYSTMSYASISLVEHGKGNPILSAIYTYRAHALNVIYRLFPDPEASLIAGIILGEQAGILTEIQDAFRLTGTSHIIVISGFNITIIAAFFTLLFSRLLGQRWGALISALAIAFYTILVGANPAVIRAAILGILTLFGHQVGRRQVGLNSLALIAALMTLIAPTVLWDVSFQLSFAATLGIMLYAEPLTTWFIGLLKRFLPQEKAEHLAGPVGEYFILTLAAQLTTLPLMVYYFKRISISALVANPLILPAQPPLMVLSGLAVLAGSIFQPLGQVFAWAAWPFTAYTIRMVEWLSTIPHGSIALGQVALPLIVLFYGLLFMFTFARTRILTLASRLTPGIPLVVLSILTVLMWKAAFYAPDGKMHVIVLDVGTGEGVLIQSPTGRAMLINGGASTIRLSEALGSRMPFFDRSLDWLVVADIDNEDLSGVVDNLERFPPAGVLWAGNTSGTRAATELYSRLILESVPVIPTQPGQALDLGSGAYLRVISTDPRGSVLLLEWENFRLLLPMGMDTGALDSLHSNSAMRNISALLLAESGYAPLNPPELIDFLHPQLAVLSVAAGDKTGLPSPETLQALDGYNLLRTDRNGWIEITTDGTQMWVEAEN